MSCPRRFANRTRRSSTSVGIDIVAAPADSVRQGRQRLPALGVRLEKGGDHGPHDASRRRHHPRALRPGRPGGGGDVQTKARARWLPGHDRLGPPAVDRYERLGAAGPRLPRYPPKGAGGHRDAPRLARRRANERRAGHTPPCPRPGGVGGRGFTANVMDYVVRANVALTSLTDNVEEWARPESA